MPAKKKATTKKAPAKKAAPAKAAPKSAVYIATKNLRENGTHYAPGEEVDLSPTRAAALGSLIKKK